MTKQTNIGKIVNSGAYGQGVVIAETDHTLTLRLTRTGDEVEVNKAGNLHYVEESNKGDNAQPCPECSSTGQHYRICSQFEE